MLLYYTVLGSLLGAKYDLFLIGPNPQVGGGGGEWVILLGTPEVKKVSCGSLRPFFSVFRMWQFVFLE